MMNKRRNNFNILSPSKDQVQRVSNFLDGLGKYINTQGPIAYKRMVFQITIDIMSIDKLKNVSLNKNLLTDIFHMASFDYKNCAEEFAIDLTDSMFFIERIKLNKGRNLYEIFFKNQSKLVLEDIARCTLILDELADEKLGKYEGWKIKRIGNHDWRNYI